MARTVIDQNTIRRINDRYLVLKTYAAVARELGISPTTVKKYIIKGYEPIELAAIKHFHFDEAAARKIEKTPFVLKEDMSDILVLSDEEKDELEDFWKELAM